LIYALTGNSELINSKPTQLGSQS